MTIHAGPLTHPKAVVISGELRPLKHPPFCHPLEAQGELMNMQGAWLSAPPLTLLAVFLVVGFSLDTQAITIRLEETICKEPV